MKLPTINNRVRAMDARTIAMPDKQRAEHCDAKHNTWSTAIRKRAGYQCERCGRRDVRLFADHIKEVADGGERYSMSNGQCLCGSCHTIKTNDERKKRLLMAAAKYAWPKQYASGEKGGVELN